MDWILAGWYRHFAAGLLAMCSAGFRFWRKMEDSNPQETIADLHVGFLDRCATVTRIFRIVRCLLDYHTGKATHAPPCPPAAFGRLCHSLWASDSPTSSGCDPAPCANCRTRTCDLRPYRTTLSHLSYAGIWKKWENGIEPSFRC